MSQLLSDKGATTSPNTEEPQPFHEPQHFKLMSHHFNINAQPQLLPLSHIICNKERTTSQPMSHHITTNESPHISTKVSPHISTKESPHIFTKESPHISTKESPHIYTNESPHIHNGVTTVPKMSLPTSTNESPYLHKWASRSHTKQGTKPSMYCKNHGFHVNNQTNVVHNKQLM